MKKLLLLISMVMVNYLSSFSQNLKALDDKNGFRDYKFGNDTTSFQNLKLEESEKGMSFYSKTDDKLNIGDSELESIHYAFYNGKLFYVTISTKGLSNSRALLDMMKELYGNGDKDNRFIEEYYWWGSNVTAHYKENSITGDASVYFKSVPISAEIQKDKEERKKSAKGDM